MAPQRKELSIYYNHKKEFIVGDIKITPYLNDHSAFDAYSFFHLDFSTEFTSVGFPRPREARQVGHPGRTSRASPHHLTLGMAHDHPPRTTQLASWGF